ncbi:hypothetical protein LQV63_24980 [Paenibacillus profundus]|uniref:Uncharacterized protein n=1 Tax=Paenibacillus profundus TaxID=1173085 RepID=A0ABS8YL29_9BACL|nr:hypothetical protein [Paenibacillus profundus]MCE5172531.1 hypothetical protein [Paenibacillus profundus]
MGKIVVVSPKLVPITYLMVIVEPIVLTITHPFGNGVPIRTVTCAPVGAPFRFLIHTVLSVLFIIAQPAGSGEMGTTVYVTP